jgi:hypothetical protein
MWSRMPPRRRRAVAGDEPGEDTSSSSPGDPQAPDTPADVLAEVEGLAEWMDRLDVDVLGPLFFADELDRLDRAVDTIAHGAALLRSWHTKNSPEPPRESTPGSPSLAAGFGEFGEVPASAPAGAGTEQGGVQ